MASSTRGATGPLERHSLTSISDEQRGAARSAPEFGCSTAGVGRLVTMTADAVDLNAKFALFSEQWSPKLVARLNDYEVKLVKVQGDFVWHTHDDTDELFLVVEGSLTIQLRDRDVTLGPGQLFVVPRGVEHCPRADDEVKVLLLEPAGVVNTGEAGGELTAVVEEI